MSEPRHIYSPTHHHQQEIREAKVQHLASDPTGWGDAVPWYLTTIHRVKMMAAGVARIIPFLANSGAPTAIGINRPASLGSTGNAADAGHEHATPDIATETTSGWMGSSHVASVNANSAHRNATGNPHGTQITDIPNLRTELDGKSNTGHGHGIPDIAGLTAVLADKAPLASPALTGTPTAPTASQGTNSTQIATTAYVRTAIADLVDTAPGTLDTLNEIAAALGDDPNFAATITSEIAGKAPIGHDHAHLNAGTAFEGLGDPFTARPNYDVRGGVRSGVGIGPFGNIWYNIVDVRHRNDWSAPGDIWGGELVWGMSSHTSRLAFRSRGGDGTPTGWTEVSTVGHGHAISDVSGLQAILDDRLPRVPVNISNGNVNAVLANGIYAGYSVANAPNQSWGVLRVYRAPSDSGDQVWQTWTAAADATNKEYRRSSFDFGASWTPWQTNKELDDIGMLQNIYWEARANESWGKVCDLTITNQYDACVVSALFTSRGVAAFAGDNSVVVGTFRVKQQAPMTSPLEIVDIDVTQLVGRATPLRFGYVVTTDNASTKVLTIYAKRPYIYSGTIGTVIARAGNVTLFSSVVESEPLGIVYVEKSLTSPTQKRVFLIGDASATVFTLTHSLGTKDVRVTVRRNSAPWDMVEVSDELDGADPDNKVKLTFYGEVPDTNEYRVVVMG